MSIERFRLNAMRKKSICLPYFLTVLLPLADMMIIKKSMVKGTKILCFHFAICTANRKKLKDNPDVFHNVFSPVMFFTKLVKNRR